MEPSSRITFLFLAKISLEVRRTDGTKQYGSLSQEYYYSLYFAVSCLWVLTFFFCLSFKSSVHITFFPLVFYNCSSYFFSLLRPPPLFSSSSSSPLSFKNSFLLVLIVYQNKCCLRNIYFVPEKLKVLTKRDNVLDIVK